MNPRMRVLVGLGNPESQYVWSRHNAGYDVMDSLAQSASASFSRDSALSGEIAYLDAQTLVVKPTTGMNDSGLCVKALIDTFGLQQTDIIVVYDDTSMPMGKLRFANKASQGRHHGIESIMKHVTEAGYLRLRVAVGPDPKGDERLDFVTKPIAQELRPFFASVVAWSADACRFWLANPMEACMSRYNGQVLKPPAV